ncbi:MAG: hypothetical protein IKS55_03225 [Oscillospiraceae bacterium]|nr:hypothetical protein [Oscillospiraceae bacterium]
MNPHTSNPYMFILEADPSRYIKTPSAAVVALIKAAEGGVALLWCFRLFGYLQQLFHGKAGAMPLEILRVLLPKEMMDLILPGAIPDGGMIGKVLCWVVSLSLFVILICMAVEAAAALLLRFALQGAKLFQITHKVLFIAVIVLLLGVTGTCVPLVLYLTQSGIKIYQVLLSGGETLLKPMRPLLVTLVCMILLLIRVSYHKGVVTVLSAIEYEIRLGFKETAMETTHMSRDALLLALIFLGAAAATGFFVEWISLYVFAFVVLAVKYFAVYNCWGDFCRRHR